MKTNVLKKALANGEITYGSWVTLADPLVPEILARAKFDWLVIDIEHTALDMRNVMSLIMSIEANGMVPLVRVGENNPNLIKRVMDMGAYGVIIPNVRTPEEAQAAVDAVKYPPVGTRGVGLYRAQKYGVAFEEYKQWLERESIVIIQIEHIAAVNRIDDIFSVPNVDGFMVGPYDLSGSMGKPGAFHEADFEKAISKVMKSSKQYKLTPGFHSVSSDPKEALRRLRQGFKFLGYSIDSIFLGDAAAKALAQVKKSQGNLRIV